MHFGRMGGPGELPNGLRCLALACGMALVVPAALAQGKAARLGCRAPPAAGYVDGYAVERRSVVVFVHGVLSNATTAWTAADGTYWPCLLRLEPAFNSSNVYVYAYPTLALGASPTIQQVGEQMLQDLNNQKVFSNHAHVTIVAHSMGGLITASMLQQMREKNGASDFARYVDRIRLVSFYGTPGTGADIASIASQFSDNVQFAEMQSQADPVDLVAGWNKVPWPFKWYCIAEGRRTGWSWLLGTRVVTPESARALCTSRPTSQAFLEDGGADHLTLVKPTAIGSTPHSLLARRFQACAGDAVYRPRPASRVQSPEGGAINAIVGALREALAGGLPGAISAEAMAAVQGALQPGPVPEVRYFPIDPTRSSLLPKDFADHRPESFALELNKLFVDQPASLLQRWVGRVSDLRQYVVDGQLGELLDTWIDSGTLADTDWVAELGAAKYDGRPIAFFRAGADADGTQRVRLRHFMLVRDPPTHCP